MTIHERTLAQDMADLVLSLQTTNANLTAKVAEQAAEIERLLEEALNWKCPECGAYSMTMKETSDED